MLNKLSFKITALLALIIITYLMSIIFITIPKIKDYVFESETRHIQDELQKISTVVEYKSKVLETFTELSLQNHKNRIKDVAQIGNDIIKAYHQRYNNGEFSLKRAQRMAYDELSKVRYGENDYFYTLNNQGILVQHADARFLGLNLYNRADEKGKFFAQELMSQAYKNGYAYTRYWWVKNKKEKVLEKIAYTTYFKPWDVYISTGVYIDDIQKSVSLQKLEVQIELERLILSTKLALNGYVYLISSDTKMMIHPHKHEKPLDIKTLNQSYKNKEAINFRVKHGSVMQDKVAWVDYNKYYDWYMVATVPKNELYHMSRNINYTILSISFIVLSFLFIVGLRFIRKLISPIEILSKNALAIQKGDLSIRNNIHSNDELGLLAEQFNYMVCSLQDNIVNLENKVSLRTKELNDKLHFDELTKLHNKFSLLQDLKVHEASTLLILDIEAFDDINELYSYHIGNKVLIEYSKFLQRFCAGTSYEIYRLYGNTFALLDKEELVTITKYEIDINELVDSTKYYKVFIEEINLDIDIEITLGAAISQDNVLKKANNALKKAKQTNKRFVVYNSTLDGDKRVENIKIWREQIKEAIENDKILPFYQPIYNRSKEIEKYETLMRMKKIDDKGELTYISPFIFLDIATKTKQYARLSEIVIRKALQQALTTNYQLSINLGFADIEDPNILNLLDEYFNKNTEVFCKRVVFEILESDHISDYEIFEEFIFKYRKLGIRFAIDDFGTGYSNFTHILTIRPDYIKIDGSLIKHINEDSDSLELVKSIVRFSQELHIKTIAEFIHNKEVFDIVYDLGVDEFQGYYFSEPIKEI